MIWDIIFWAALIYIGGVILFHLYFTIMMIIEGYADNGFWGAVGMGFASLLMNVWNLAKFALTILIFALIIRACSGKDYVGLDKANLKADVKSIIYFLDNYEYNNPPDYNEDLEKFKKRIRDYTPEEISKLKEFSKIYISYRKAFQDDFKESFLSYIPGENFTLTASKKADDLRKILNTYDIKEKLELEDKEIEKLIMKLNTEFSKYSEDEILDRQYEVENDQRDVGLLMATVYKNIFNEEYHYE